jgi:hypothetical protein
VVVPHPSPIVASGGGKEGPAQETVSRRLQLDAPFVLTLVDFVSAEQLSEGIPVIRALVNPGLRHCHELSGAVSLLDVDEPRPFE